MIKKLISLALSACLFFAALPAFCGVYAAEEKSVEDKRISEMSALGILNDMNLVEFDPERTVVKKVFYSAVYNIMTEEEESDEALIEFLGRYNINIESAELGDNLKKSEALEAVVCMLGFSNRALENDALLDAATELGLRRYVSGDISEDITLGEMVNLLYASVKEDMLTVSVTGGANGFEYKRLDDITPLIYYRDIYEVKGYLNKNSYASIVDNAPAVKGYVYIDDEEFSAGLTNAGDYLGMPVEAYVKYNDDDEGTIVYIAPNDRYVNVISLEADEILSVDDDMRSIEYEYGDRIKRAELSSVVKVIFNGKNYTEYTKEDFMPDIGNIELIDSDNDDTVDVVNIKSYETVLVNYVSVYDELVVNKYHNPGTVDLDSSENEVIIEKDGQLITLAEIAPNNILLVAASRSGSDEVIRVYVSDEQVTGMITGIDYSENELTAGDVLYNISQGYINEIEYEEEILNPPEGNAGGEFVSSAKRPEAGKNYTLYLDAFGNVAYAVLRDGNIYLFATRLWYEPSDDTYGMKALDTEGTWNNYIFEDKLRFDGLDKKQSAEQVYKALGEDSFSRQLVRVELNSEGKIRSLMTARKVTAADETGFTRYDMTTRRIYQNGSMSLGAELFLTSDTKVFLIPPEEDAADNEYQVTGASWFRLDSWYQVSGYDIDKFYRAPVVTYESTERTLNNYFYIVSKVSSEVLDGEVRTVLECYYQGSQLELVVEAGYDMPEVKAGDMIRIATNLSGEINHMEIYKSLTDEIEKTYPSLTDATAIHKGMVLASGYVTEVGVAENMFLADCGNDTPARFKFINETQVYLYDGKEKEKIRMIEPSDIKPGDGVFVLISWTNARIVYVVRNV